MVAYVLVELSNRNIDKVFSYKIPSNLESKIQIGMRVLVSFARCKLEGFVMDIKPFEDEGFELKEIIDVVDREVLLTDELLKLGNYLKEKTLSTLISTYQVMLPKGYKAHLGKKVGIKYETYLFLDFEKALNYPFTEKQKEIIKFLNLNKRGKYSYLKSINSSVDTLLKKGILKKEKMEVYRFQKEYIQKEKHKLTDMQQQVVDAINLNSYKTYLLHGVTGSGKTEIYMEIIEKVIRDSQQAMMLIPEISLTPQIVKRFIERFGSDVAVFHSGLSDTEKYDEYRKIKRGEVNIVVGARSAIFLPLKKIGVIIIDEEHSNSYKQENMPRYNAIDVAKWRGEYHNCPVILGSATPSLEAYSRGVKGVYQLLTLNKRVYDRALPRVVIVDLLKSKKRTRFFTEILYQKMQEVLEKGEQVILFLNKRGYATTISCSSCGKTFVCPNCDITLTYHKTSEMLRCHYCGYAEASTKTCPNCHDELIKSGMGTQQIEEEINNLFSRYQTVRMDFDTTTKKGSHEKILEDYRNQKYQILIGTQMISKGLDFPNVTLVGVINADQSLNIPDFRSSETTFSLLNQVSGRSGRGDKNGVVVIQTYNPNHYAISYAATSDYLGFFKLEMNHRKLLNYPPYCYLVLVRIKGSDYQELSMEAKKIKEFLVSHLNFSILGPTVATPFRVNSIYRFNIIIKYKKEENLYIVLNQLLDHYKTNHKINIEIDFDPKSF